MNTLCIDSRRIVSTSFSWDTQSAQTKNNVQNVKDAKWWLKPSVGQPPNILTTYRNISLMVFFEVYINGQIYGGVDTKPLM